MENETREELIKQITFDQGLIDRQEASKKKVRDLHKELDELNARISEAELYYTRNNLEVFKANERLLANYKKLFDMDNSTD